MESDEGCKNVSEKIYNTLLNKSSDILYDDRDCSIGKKLSDNELIGIPFQIVVGKRDLKDNLVELKDRSKNNSLKMSPEDVINFLSNEIILS